MKKSLQSSKIMIISLFQIQWQFTMYTDFFITNFIVNIRYIYFFICDFLWEVWIRNYNFWTLSEFDKKIFFLHCPTVH